MTPEDAVARVAGIYAPHHAHGAAMIEPLGKRSFHTWI
jgi:prolyl-tRNA synthetase